MAALASPAYAKDKDDAQPQSQTPSGNASTQVTTTTQGQATAGNPDNQTTGAETNTTNEIVVTAEFRSASLQNTPIAITAINGAMLDQRGQTDIAQVAAQAPNVTLNAQPQTGGIGLIAFIRGVGQTDFDYALEPGVGIYVDDVYIPTLSSSLLNLMDVDRVEILRGPQGVLGGKNSIGGSIKVFSKKPTGSNTGYLEVGYGKFNQLTLRGMADIKINDTLSMRVSGVAMSHNGWVDIVDYGLTHPNSNVPANNARGHYAVTNKEGSQNMQAGKLALRWQPSSNIDINISGDYTNEKDSPVPDILIAAGHPVGNDSRLRGFDFNPATSYAAVNANGGAFLPGKNGAPVPYNCAFVASGPYSCDGNAQLPGGVDPRYMSYANFLDGMVPTSQSPYKPYAALQDSDFVGWGLMGNVQLNLSDAAKITWISSYRQYQSNFSQDQDGSPVPIAQLDNQLNAKAWSQELRLGGDLGHGFFDYTIGGFYMKQNNRYTARVDLNYAGIDFVHGPDLTPSTSKALFFNGTIHPTEAWSITGGVRRSWDQKTYTYFRSNPDGTVPFQGALAPPPGVPPICQFFLGAPTAGPTGIGNSPNCLLTGLYGVQGSFKGKRWDWRAVTDYRFSPEFLAYASISTGYMAGGVNPRPFFGPSAGECDAPGYVAPAPCNQIKPFRPETLTTYEVGFKSDLFDRRLRLNGAAFYNKFNDIILTLSACPSVPCIQPRNVGKATVKGFELEMEAHPMDGFELDGALSYIDFKYNKASVAAAGLTGTETSPYTPKWTWSLGAQYDIRTPNDSDFGLRVDGSYQSKIYSEVFNSPWGAINGRFLANGRIFYKSPGDDWELAVEVKNIFNKYYFVTKEDVVTAFGAVLGQPGMPRTWLASVRRNFGATPPPPPPPAPVPEVAPAPAPAPAPVATYKQCLDGSVVPMEQACPAPPAPPVPPQGERG
jgi:iron complex outermembrane receptor protein